MNLALDREQQKNPTGGMRYEYQKFLRSLQAIEQLAIAAERKAGRAGEEAKRRVAKKVTEMITTPEVSSKIRESGQVLDHLLQTDATELEKIELIEEVFDDIADRSVTFQGFRENNRIRMGKTGKTVHSPMPGDLYILGDREIIVIESRGEGYTRAIEGKLRGLVTDLSPKGGTEMIRRINELVSTKHKQHRYIVDNGKLKRHPEGCKLPNNDEFQGMCNNAILPQRLLIQRWFRMSREEALTDAQLCLLIFRITGGLLAQDRNPFIKTAFKLRESKKPPIVEVSAAFNNFYTVPTVVEMSFPDQHLDVVLDTNEDNDIGICLLISSS